MLKPEIERLSDVDLAVEVASKETDFDRARVKNDERIEILAVQGHRFRNFVEQEGGWYWGVFGFLKGRSRVISLSDYKAEKTFVLAVPHRFLIGPGTDSRAAEAKRTGAIDPESASARPAMLKNGRDRRTKGLPGSSP